MKLRPIAAVLILVALLAASAVIGAYRGWNKEYAKVQEISGTIDRMLISRVESATNILKVASRHLPSDDATVLALMNDRDILAGDAPLHEKAVANAALDAHANQTLAALKALGSVQNDKRDKMYVESLLPQMLAESGQMTVQTEYNKAAKSYNDRLNASAFSGRIARLLGVKQADVFGQK